VRPDTFAGPAIGAGGGALVGAAAGHPGAGALIGGLGGGTIGYLVGTEQQNRYLRRPPLLPRLLIAAEGLIVRPWNAGTLRARPFVAIDIGIAQNST